VVLSHGQDVPSDFLTSLQQNGIDVTVIRHPVAAFAALAILQRDRPRDSGWGLLPRPRIALIIADRERWANLEPLLSAVRRHLPDISVWIGASDLWVEVTSPPPSDLPEHSPLPDLPPTLRLAGDPQPPVAQVPVVKSPTAPLAPPDVPSGPEPSSQAPRTRPPMDTAVTAEEIEMLLRLFPNEPGDETQGESGNDPTRPSSGPERGS
jgi:hypothetical protein